MPTATSSQDRIPADRVAVNWHEVRVKPSVAFVPATQLATQLVATARYLDGTASVKEGAV